MKIKLEDIQDCLYRFDLINRPYIIYCHPSVKEQLEQLGDHLMIEDIPWMEKDKVIIIDRMKLEEENKKLFEKFADYKDIGKGDENESFARKYR